MKKTMNHKPGSVVKNLWFFALEFCFTKLRNRRLKPYPAAICLGSSLRTLSKQSTRGIGRAVLPLLDFAPDVVCRIIFN